MMRIALPWILLLALPLSGCGTTQPSRLYLLNVSEEAQPIDAVNHTVGLGPIKFPAYLDRNKIIVQTGRNRFEAAEYHRWAEPLEKNFTRVLNENLANDLPNAVVTPFPWHGGKEIEFQILIEVFSFDSDDNNRARLHVRWELLDAAKNSLAAPQRREFIKTAGSGDFDARVRAMSGCVAELSRELAQAIAGIAAQ